jgi:hypothetical protein
VGFDFALIRQLFWIAIFPVICGGDQARMWGDMGWGCARSVKPAPAG